MSGRFTIEIPGREPVVAHNTLMHDGGKNICNFSIGTFLPDTWYSWAWYVYFIGSSGLSGTAATDTPASHPGWTEVFLTFSRLFILAPPYPGNAAAAADGKSAEATMSSSFVTEASAAVWGIALGQPHPTGGDFFLASAQIKVGDLDPPIGTSINLKYTFTVKT